MKAIIIAAGQGTRLGALTKDEPKSLAIKLGGRPLLELQLDMLRNVGIDEIGIVRGYLAEKMQYSDVQYFLNSDYQHNNILASLFYAEKMIHGDVLVSYGDIWFESSVLDQLLSAKGDIVIACDPKWRESYAGRDAAHLASAELVSWDDKGTVRRVGRISKEQKIEGEFIGLFKLTSQGAQQFKQAYHSAQQKYVKGPFQHAQSFPASYPSDLLQELADQSHAVQCCAITGKWGEIDTPEDLIKAQSFFGKTP